MTIVHLILRYTHISMGMVGLISGAAAMTLRKGSSLHRQSGNVFFVSMLIMSAVGALISVTFKPNMGNVMGGLLTFYLVASAWLTVWRKPAETGSLELGTALLGLATVITGAVSGLTAMHSARHMLDGYPPPMYFIFASIALLGTVLDVRMIARGGLTGAARLTRHLWRMCVAMFMAAASFFFGQAKFFPPAVRESGVLKVPVLLIVGALVYWLICVRVLPLIRKRRAFRRTAAAQAV